MVDAVDQVDEVDAKTGTKEQGLQSAGTFLLTTAAFPYIISRQHVAICSIIFHMEVRK